MLENHHSGKIRGISLLLFRENILRFIQLVNSFLQLLTYHFLLSEAVNPVRRLRPSLPRQREHSQPAQRLRTSDQVLLRFVSVLSAKYARP